MKSLCFSFALAFIFCAAQNALAWGPEGHTIIASIARMQLQEPARTEIDRLLKTIENEDKHPDGFQMDGKYIPNFADIIRVLNHTNAWHYVDIPYQAHSFDPARDCVPTQEDSDEVGGCVISEIDQNVRDIENKDLPDRKREAALKYLIHFVGDIHQPLHCIDYNDDRGGNSRAIEYFKQIDPKGRNLHHMWDTLILAESLSDRKDIDTLHAYAKMLNNSITPKQKADWTKNSNATAWAMESHDLAVKFAYDLCTPDKTQTIRITQQYVQSRQPIVDMQLKKAGVRLAMLLNEAFTDSVPQDFFSTPEATSAAMHN